MRKAEEKDLKELSAYLGQNPAMNLFLIGDIENFGVDGNKVSVWMDEDASGIHSVFLYYAPGRSLILQSYEHRIDQKFLEELIQQLDPGTISGETSLIRELNLDEFPVHSECRFAAMKKPYQKTDTSEVARLGPKDAEDIMELLNASFPHSRVSKVNTEEKGSRYYGIRKNGNAVSVAASSAECRNLAMVVSVCTNDEYRCHGYAEACVTKLSDDLLAEGRMPCLFYTNPQAAKIYKKIGYEDIGYWSMRQK